MHIHLLWLYTPPFLFVQLFVCLFVVLVEKDGEEEEEEEEEKEEEEEEEEEEEGEEEKCRFTICLSVLTWKAPLAAPVTACLQPALDNCLA